MSSSLFCLQQRQQEQRRLKKILIGGLAFSTISHLTLAYIFPRWSQKSKPTAEKPIELIVVDKPKPEPQIETKPIVEPKPIPKPEPVKAQTPPPPVKPPEQIKAQTPPPKPTPQKVLTSSTPTSPSSIISAPISDAPQTISLSDSFTAPINSNTAIESSHTHPGANNGVVASNSAPPRPQASQGKEEGISCISNCTPEYPAALEGAEGSVGVRLTINSGGKVAGIELASASDDNRVNREALLAAREMQFTTPPGGNSASVIVEIDFTVEGSEYDRLAREEQEKREQAEQEKKEQEIARKQQLEAAKQAIQEKLEQERQARQQQSTSSPPQVKPPTDLSPEELDAERLRKFRERIKNSQN